MKRGRIVARRGGRRGGEVRHPSAPSELGSGERSAVSRELGVTSRRLLRFVGFSTGSQVDNGGVVGSCDRVWRSSQARVSSSVLCAKAAATSSLEVYNDRGDDCFSSVLEIAAFGAGPEKLQRRVGEDGRGKENVDPRVACGGTSSGSPLPEWFTRKPLQDLTGVFAAGLGDDLQSQPKKKLKKVGAAAAPSFPSMSETPTRRGDSTKTQPKCSSFATPKQFSNLGKNFR